MGHAHNLNSIILKIMIVKLVYNNASCALIHLIHAMNALLVFILIINHVIFAERGVSSVLSRIIVQYAIQMPTLSRI